MNFFAGAFAVAALLAAAGPIIIHLLNRRRFRTVEWAAMDFLREAVQRNRKILQLRDLLLLALRVLCVLLFGLALARPYFTTLGGEALFRYVWLSLAIVAAFALAIFAIVSTQRAVKAAAGAACLLAGLLSAWGVTGVVRDYSENAGGALSSRHPVHAVLVIDNSQSMGYESLDGTLLDQARGKAAEFIDALPAESRISVIPLCGPEGTWSLDAYRNRNDARDALNRIQVVDLGGRATRAIELAAEACARVPELDAKRVVFIGDQQVSAWPADGLQAALETIPELQVVQVAAESPENVWVSDFRLQDGIADVETPAVFLATVQYQGRSPLTRAQVTLAIDDLTIASQTIDLEPGQARQVEFSHQLDVPAEPGRPSYVTAAVEVHADSVEGDRLKHDNRRFIAAPVLAGVPVVFVDQYGPDEDLARGRIGETYRLRRLLAPRQSREESRRQLIRIRHTTIDRLDQQTLEDARLVVIAGVADCGEAVPLLREYVRQGGPLVLMAGADFDPVAWNDRGWLDGQGILPAPLKDVPLGETPEEAVNSDRLDPFFLAFESLQHDEFFRIEGEPDEALRDLYRLPLFFKAVQADLGDEAIARLLETEALRIEEERAFLAEADERYQQWAEMEQQGTFGPTEEALRRQDEEHRRTVEPNWLLWRADQASGGRQSAVLPANLSAADLAERTRPVVRASFAGHDAPFLVERRIGDGRVMFFSSGAYSSWNTLTQSNAILVFDRIFRNLLEETIPSRIFAAGERISLPAERGEFLRYTLTRPSGSFERAEGLQEFLSVEALGPDTHGVSIRNAVHSGPYVVTAQRIEPGSASLTGEKLWEHPLVVNSPVEESDLRTLNAEGLKQRLGDANYRWIAAHEPISLEGAQIRGRDLWKTLALLALIFLLAEMLILAWPTLRSRAAGANV